MNLQYEKAYLVLWWWFALLAAATLANLALWIARVSAPARYVRRHLFVRARAPGPGSGSGSSPSANSTDSPADAASVASTGPDVSPATSTATSDSAAKSPETTAAAHPYRRPPCTQQDIGELLSFPLKRKPQYTIPH